MNLRENISTHIRRRTHLIDRVIHIMLQNMYPCDYNSSDHFVEGVLDEIRWFLLDVEELQGIERADIENYIFDYKYDELTNYFNEHCIVLKNDNLQESIRRILREDKDHTNLLKGIIDSSDIFDYKYFCGVDIITPEEISDQYKFQNINKIPYLIKVYFVGGPNSEVWPRTQAIRNKESDLMEELHEYITSLVPFNIEIMSSHVNSCEGYDKLMKRKYSTDDLQESIKKILKEEVAEPKKNSIKDSLQQMIDDEGVMFAAEFVGGVDNLVNLLHGGDLKSFYKENNLIPYKYSDNGMEMYIDDLLVRHMASPLHYNKKEKSLGNFSYGSKNGIKYRFDTRVDGPRMSKDNQLWWRVIGTSGDYGFGYGWINARNTLGKKYRQQIFQQIIDRYNLNQYM